MRTIVIEEKDSGKLLGEYRVRDPQKLDNLCKRLKLRLEEDYYSDGMTSKWRTWLISKDGTVYRYYMLSN